MQLHAFGFLVMLGGNNGALEWFLFNIGSLPDRDQGLFQGMPRQDCIGKVHSHLCFKV